MKPGQAHLLMGAAMTLGTRVIPALDPASYSAGDAKMIAILLLMLAQDAGRATDRLVRENAALRTLFTEAAQLPLSPELLSRIEAAVTSPRHSLLLDDLEAEHCVLEALLIDLHGHVETIGQLWAASLNSAIWQYLLKRAEDRMLVLPDTA